MNNMAGKQIEWVNRSDCFIPFQHFQFFFEQALIIAERHSDPAADFLIIHMTGFLILLHQLQCIPDPGIHDGFALCCKTLQDRCLSAQ